MHDKKQKPIQETNLSSYNYETANWKNIKASLKQVKWIEIIEKCDSSEKKITKIIKIVMKIIEKRTPLNLTIWLRWSFCCQPKTANRIAHPGG